VEIIIDAERTLGYSVYTMKKEVKTIISEIVEKLKREYKPQRIILFGSYAYGNPTEDSDIDLLILKNTDKRRVDRFVQVKRIIIQKGTILYEGASS